MRKLVSSAVVAGTVVAGAIGLGAPSAFAATWHVTGGPAFTATNSGNLSFKDTTTNQPFVCTGSTASGNAPNGLKANGNGLATLSNGTFTGCTGNFGSNGTASLSAGTLNGVSYASGTTTGTLTGVVATLVIHDLFGTCNAGVTGSVNNVTYSNTGLLTITADPSPGNLTINSATGSGCAGLIASGNKATFAGKYKVSPIITIVSP